MSPRVGGRGNTGVTRTARFDDPRDANRATRALMKELKLRPTDVRAVLSPGPVSEGAGYLGITRSMPVIVHVSARQPDQADAIAAILLRSGGEMLDDIATRSTGGYGPTSAHGRESIIGGASTTSAMATHRFTEAPETPAAGE